MSRYSAGRGDIRQEQETEESLGRRSRPRAKFTPRKTVGRAGPSEVPSPSGYAFSNDYTESNGWTTSNDYTASNGYTAPNEYTASDGYTASNGYTARNSYSNTKKRNQARNVMQNQCEMCQYMNPPDAPHCFSCSQPLPVYGEANTRRPVSRQDPSSQQIVCQMCQFMNPVHLDYCRWCSQPLPKDAKGLPAGVGAGVGGLALGVMGTLAVGAALVGEAVRPVRR